jgi:hypothetical protein
MSTSSERRSAGLVPSSPELIAYVPNDGLHIKVRYRDDRLKPPEDNEFDLAFVLDTEALNALNDRRKVTAEVDARRRLRSKTKA